MIYLVPTLTHGFLFYTVGYNSLYNPLFILRLKLAPDLATASWASAGWLHCPFDISTLFSEYFLTVWCNKIFWAYIILPLPQPWNWPLLWWVLTLFSGGMVFRNQDRSISLMVIGLQIVSLLVNVGKLYIFFLQSHLYFVIFQISFTASSGGILVNLV